MHELVIYCAEEDPELAHLQVRDIDERLYASLRARAVCEKRSISQEVILILEKYLSAPNGFDTNPTDALLSLAGAWEDGRDAETIARELRLHRRSGTRFTGDGSVFD